LLLLVGTLYLMAQRVPSNRAGGESRE